MLGRFGKSLIGINHLTGPVSHSEQKTARFARHELVRGAPVLQDLGDDAETQSLSFFFDETFCDPERELRKIEAAFRARIPLELFFDLLGFRVGVFLIESLAVENRKTTASGRVTRIELEVSLIESSVGLGNGLGAIASAARALINPLLKRN